MHFEGRCAHLSPKPCSARTMLPQHSCKLNSNCSSAHCLMAVSKWLDVAAWKPHDFNARLAFPACAPGALGKWRHYTPALLFAWASAGAGACLVS